MPFLAANLIHASRDINKKFKELFEMKNRETINRTQFSSYCVRHRNFSIELQKATWTKAKFERKTVATIKKISNTTKGG